MRADDGSMLVVKAPAPYAPRHLDTTARYAVFAFASSLLVECWRQAGGGSYGSESAGILRTDLQRKENTPTGTGQAEEENTRIRK